MRLQTLTEVVEAEPGTEATCRVRLTNDRPGPASYRVRVHGLGTVGGQVDVPGDPVDPGESLDLLIPLPVPSNVAAGSHSIAIEVHSSRPDDLHGIVDLRVDIGALDRVVLHVEPDVIRGGRSTAFTIAVANRRSVPTDVHLSGEGPQLEVSVAEPRITVAPGEEVRVRAVVKGPEHRTGDPLLHTLTVTARGGASPAHATASFRQRATFPGKLRRAIAIVTVIAMWVSIVGVAAWWWVDHSRTDAKSSTTTERPIDTSTGNGNGSENGGTTDGSGTGTGTGTGSGTGSGGGSGDGTGSGGSGGGTGAGGGTGTGGAADVPTKAAIEGKIRTPKPADSVGVVVSLTPIKPGDTAAPSSGTPTSPSTTAPSSAAPASSSALGSGLAMSFRPPSGAVPRTGTASVAAPRPLDVVGDQGSGEPTKVWPAMWGVYTPEGTPTLPRTATVASLDYTIEKDDGRFAFAAQPLQQNYELSVWKEGFDRKSIVVVPNADGTPLDLDLTLTPAQGEIGGVVTGPNGPLGGVDLVITDGSLRFEATSSTDPQHLGEFKVLGLSTPGAYTVQATRPGLGTAVLLQPLGNGKKVTDLVIPMRTGVGTISGKVSAGGVGLGGVTVTVTNGDFSRTSNTFTEGDVGVYAFPDLPVPGTYVVAVQAAGYLPQTQQVRLDSNASGIDFRLVKASGAIKGIVRSVKTTGTEPLPQVGITAVGDSLEVRTISRASGTPGSFELDNLPPGDYTVSFLHFSHAPKTILVTVTAGGTNDLGFVDLDYTPGSDLVQTGSFQVEVRGLLQAGGSEPLTGWTLEYSKRPNGTPQQFPAAGVTTSSSENVPVGIGTYDLTFRLSGYRDFRVLGVSVGLQPVPVAVQMLQLGQAYGIVYDFDAGVTEPTTLNAYPALGGYTYSILDNAGNQVPNQTLLVPDSTSAQPTWSSALSIATGIGLGTGTYQLRIDSPPPGYYIDPAQTLRQFRVGALPVPLAVSPMRFSIPADSIDQVGPLLVKAERYPTVAGTITFQPGSPALPANSSALVSLTCGNGTTITQTANATGQTAPYSFTRAQVATLFTTGRTSGSCTLKAVPTVSGRTFQQATADPFTLSVGTDRTIDLVVVEKGSLGGALRWSDAGNANAFVSFAGSSITVTRPAGAVIALATASDGSTRQITDPLPSATTTSSGSWGLDGQVWGTTTYSVTGTDIVAGDFSITIDATGVSVQSGTNVTATRDPGSGAINLTLVPQPGTIDGTIVLKSTTPDAGGFGVTATGPATASSPVTVVDARNLTYRVTTCATPGCVTAAAGTWNIAVNAPAGYRLQSSSGITPAPLLGPNGALTPSSTYVELASLAVSVFQPDRNGANPTVIDLPGNTHPVVKLALKGSPTTIGDLPPSGGYTDTNADGNYPITNLAVDNTDPEGSPVTYELTVVADGYSFNEATVSIDGLSAPIVLDANGVAVVEVTLAAGQSHTVDVLLPKYGTLTGTATGFVRSTGTALSLADQLSVIYQAVDANGALTGPVRTAAPGTGNEFVLAAPAGCYAVTVTHPFYENPTAASVPSSVIVTNPSGNGNAITNNCPTSGGRPTYPIQSKKDESFSSSFGLNAKKSALKITVMDSSSGVAGADVVVLDGATTMFSCRAADTTPCTTNASGALPTTYSDAGGTITALTGTTDLVLWPGPNVVQVRRVVSGHDLSFPVDLTVNVPYGDTLASRVITVVANTINVGGTIDGTGLVKAKNKGGRAIDMPVSITVDRSATVLPGSTVGGTSQPNEASEDTLVVKPLRQIIITSPTPPLAGGAAPTTSGGYKFTDLPFGFFDLTFSPAGGYTAPAKITSEVASSSASAIPAEVVYEAQNVTVAVTVLSDNATPGDPSDDTALTDATVSLTPPAVPGGSALPVTHGASDAAGVYTRANVMPEIGAYQLSVSSPLHAAVTGQSVRIVPQSTLRQAITVTLHLTSVTVTGTVTRLDTTGGSSLAAPSDAKAYLFTSGTNTVVAGPVDASSGSFTLTAGAGSYRVDVTAAGYQTASSEITVGAVTPGGTVDAGAFVLKKQLSISFLVKTSTNAAVSGALITMGTASDTTVAGAATLAVVAGDTMSYTVTKSGYVTATGTANPALSPNPVTFDPTIRGTAFNAGSTTPSLTMYLCSYTTGAAACDATTQVQQTATASGNYVFAAPAGRWWVKALAPNGKYSAVDIYVLSSLALSVDGTNTIASMPALDIIDLPTTVAATAGADGVSATVTFDRSAGLTAEVRLDSGAWVSVGTAKTYTFTGLAPSTSYTVSVRTKSTFGVSAPVSTTVTTGVVPAPTGLTLTPATTSVAATWTATTGLTYEVRIYVTGNTPGAWTAASSTTGHTFTGLTSATGYTVEVRGSIGGHTSAVTSATTTTT